MEQFSGRPQGDDEEKKDSTSEIDRVDLHLHFEEKVLDQDPLLGFDLRLLRGVHPCCESSCPALGRFPFSIRLFE
jgi:hypothetical protein